MGLTPRLGRSPREGLGNLLQCSWLENSMGRGAWRAAVHGTAKRLCTHTHTHETFSTIIYMVLDQTQGDGELKTLLIALGFTWLFDFVIVELTFL